MPTPAPQRAKRAAAQITEQSRVDKLACQRGGEGCSVAARRRTSAGHSPKGAPRTCATRSRVQIYATVTFVAVFFCFLRRWRDLPTPAPQRAKRAAAQITEQSRVDKLACQRGGEGCSVAARRRTSAGRSPKGAPRTCATRSRVQTRFLFIRIGAKRRLVSRQAHASVPKG